MSIVQEIENSWGWTGIKPDEVVGENDFGNLMVKDVEGQYWRICPEDIYCQVIANDRSELDALSKDQEFLRDWYMQQLVEQAKEHFSPLSEGRKFHLVIPGVLDGEYATSNIKTVSQVEQIRFSGDLGKQIESLPDGAQVQLKVID